jgi:microcystin-dependent protein
MSTETDVAALKVKAESLNHSLNELETRTNTLQSKTDAHEKLLYEAATWRKATGVYIGIFGVAIGAIVGIKAYSDIPIAVENRVNEEVAKSVAKKLEVEIAVSRDSAQKAAGEAAEAAQSLKGLDSRLKTNPFLSAPVGSVFAFAGTKLPEGFLWCNGEPQRRDKYSELYDVIKETHGRGNGFETFNVPDYRGRFLRGVDDASTRRDAEAEIRTPMQEGGNLGRHVGSVQADAFREHDHGGMTITPKNVPASSLMNWVKLTYDKHFNSFQKGDENSPHHMGMRAYQWERDGEHQHGIKLEGGAETRPKNAYVNFIIKY